MTGFVVLSTGLQGRVRAAGSALEEGVDLGVFEALSGRVTPAAARGRTADQLARRLSDLLGPRARGTVVGLVVPDPGDREVLTSMAEVLEAHGFSPAILAPRTALAREALRRANQTVGAATWLLDASATGFTVFSLDGAKRIAVRQDLDQLFEYRRTVVAAAFKAEHRVDIKHVGGTPERIDAWLEELQRSGRLEAEQHVEWQAPEGASLPLRSQALSKALQNVHASAVLAMENACLEALTEHAGAVVVSGSVDAWFHIGPKLRGALPDTYVHILEEDEESALLEGLLERMGEPGTGKVWMLAAGGDAPFGSLEWEPLPPVALAAEDAPTAPPAPRPRPEPEPVAAAPAPPPAPVVVQPEPRSRAGLYAVMAGLAAAQALMVLGYYAGGGREDATEDAAALRAEFAGAAEERDALRAQLSRALERQDELRAELGRVENEAERLALVAGESSGDSSAIVQEALAGLRADMAQLESDQAELGELSAALSGIATRLEEVEGSVGGLHTEVTALEAARLDGAAERNDRVDALDTRVAALDERLGKVDRHETVIAELSASVAAARAALEALPDEATSTGGGRLIDASALAELTERVDRTETSLQELRGTFPDGGDASLIEPLLYPDLSAQRMRVFNAGQTRIARVGEDSEGHGSMKLYNDVGEFSVLLGSGQGGDAGFVGTYGREGQELFVATSHAGSGAAHVALNNKDGRRRIAMTTNSNDDAVLWLFNREGKVVEVLGGGGDLAEAVRPAAGADLRPGMVVRAVGADADGPLVVPTDSAADPRALGILSGAGDLLPAMTFNRTRAEGEQAVALAGQVFCLVDATGAPVRPGDLLVSAARPGHARRADDSGAPPGAVLGKAVEALDSGTGLIRVWIGSR